VEAGGRLSPPSSAIDAKLAAAAAARARAAQEEAAAAAAAGAAAAAAAAAQDDDYPGGDDDAEGAAWREMAGPGELCPFAGWLGATQRCCSCGDTRPVKNEPFNVISLALPAAQSSDAPPPRQAAAAAAAAADDDDGNGGSGGGGGGGCCTLEACLASFVAPERVAGVECMRCAWIERAAETGAALEIASGAAARGGGAAGTVGAWQQSLAMGGGDGGDGGFLLGSDGRTGDTAWEGGEGAAAAAAAAAEQLDRVQALEARLRDSSRPCFGVGGSSQARGGGQQQQQEEQHRHCLFGSRAPPEPAQSTMRKRHFVSRAPAALCLHFHRRHFARRTGRIVKLRQLIRFDCAAHFERLCAFGGTQHLGEYGSGIGGGRTAAAGGAGGDGGPGKLAELLAGGAGGASPRYELCAVIVHHGSMPDGGHYTTYRRLRPPAGSPDAATDDGSTWVHCDDGRVRHVTEDQALSCEAYMLFYSQA